MAHEIMEHDSMMTVHEPAWHGLGVTIPDYVTPEEAQQLSGLTWVVNELPIQYRKQYARASRLETFPDKKMIQRADTQEVLAVVGSKYVPFQNYQMWEFMTEFCKTAESKIETAGSLRNGRVVWALAHAGETEYLKNDPIQKYLLFSNTFTGERCIEVLFTDVRVVCNNTLTAALNHSSNTYRVRHLAGAEQRLRQIEDALAIRFKNDAAMTEAMHILIKREMSEKEMQSVLRVILKKEKKAEERAEESNYDDPNALITGVIPNADEELAAEESVSSYVKRVMADIMELVETGAGTDIPGVKGTAYGLLNAVTEYSDHYRPTHGQWDYSEANFESALMGTGRDLKQRTLRQLLAA